MPDMEFTPTPRPRPPIDSKSKTMTAQLLNQGGALELEGAAKQLADLAILLPEDHRDRSGLELAIRMLVTRVAEIKVGL